MQKKQFLAVMDALKQQYDKDERIDKFLSKEFNECGHFFFNETHSALWNCLMQLLYDKFDWEEIDYFVYEMEFGMKWKKGMITDKDGNDVDLSSAEKLWKYLNA
jgi:hypothetical protein